MPSQLIRLSRGCRDGEDGTESDQFFALNQQIALRTHVPIVHFSLPVFLQHGSNTYKLRSVAKT